MKIKEFIYLFIYGPKSTSKRYYKYLKKKGITLGNNVNFYNPPTINIDITRPFMINIGNNVHITKGVTILTHGYDWSVLHNKYGKIYGSAGSVNIGNNVFIGNNSTILKNVTIKDNIIIGANSLVNKDCINEGVYAGNPAKFIMSLEEYEKKISDRQQKEAEELFYCYYKKYNRIPNKNLFREFFWLFENDSTKLNKSFMKVMHLDNNYDNTIEKFVEKKKIFNSYEEFVDNCIKKMSR